MYYEINISKNGVHFFATAERSITNIPHLSTVFKELNRAFREEDGYELSVSSYALVGDEFITDKLLEENSDG